MTSEQEEIFEFLRPGRLSPLTLTDMAYNYQYGLSQMIRPDAYFIDRESDTLCAFHDEGEYIACIRLEGRGHHCTLGLVRRIRQWLDLWSKRGKPILVQTPRIFYEKGKARKLLRLTGFEYYSETRTYIISRYVGPRRNRECGSQS